MARTTPTQINDAGWCTQGNLSSSDPNLVAGFPDPQGGGFRDRLPTGPVSSAHTFTYKVNLSGCLRGFDIGFASGQTQGFHFEAFTPIQGGGSAGVDNAAALVFFKRQ